MWDKIQAVSEQDWAWIGTVIGSVALGLMAALRGMKKTPAQVGLPVTVPLNACDSTPLITETRRDIGRVISYLEDHEKKMDLQRDTLHLIHVDTQVIRSRKGD